MSIPEYSERPGAEPGNARLLTRQIITTRSPSPAGGGHRRALPSIRYDLWGIAPERTLNEDRSMGLVPPNHGPHPDQAVRPGARLVTTRPVEVLLERVWHGEKVVLPAGTCLRHLRTEYAAECIPPIEYADIHCDVQTGPLAGREVVLLTFEMNAPVPEMAILGAEYGIVLAEETMSPSLQ
jgi:hypothetical protein